MKILNHYGCIYRISDKKYKKFLKYIAKHGDCTFNTQLARFGAKKIGTVNLTTRALQNKSDAKFLLDMEKTS